MTRFNRYPSTIIEFAKRTNSEFRRKILFRENLEIFFKGAERDRVRAKNRNFRTRYLTRAPSTFQRPKITARDTADVAVGSAIEFRAPLHLSYIYYGLFALSPYSRTAMQPPPLHPPSPPVQGAYSETRPGPLFTRQRLVFQPALPITTTKR